MDHVEYMRFPPGFGHMVMLYEPDRSQLWKKKTNNCSELTKKKRMTVPVQTDIVSITEKQSV